MMIWWTNRSLEAQNKFEFEAFYFQYPLEDRFKVCVCILWMFLWKQVSLLSHHIHKELKATHGLSVLIVILQVQSHDHH